jgi:hypothetical protein
MRYVVDLIQATILATLIGGPLFYYFLFVMQP